MFIIHHEYANYEHIDTCSVYLVNMLWRKYYF